MLTPVYHKQKREIMKEKEEMTQSRISREEKIGMNIFRTRYLGIMQGKTRVNYEEDKLKTKLNDEDAGDTHHGRSFSKILDNTIYESMNANIRHSINGFVMDKITPRKKTGQVHAVIVPVPENSFDKHLLVPMMVELPPPNNLSAKGLPETAKKVFNDAEFSDDQLKGIGWDGEYVKKGVKMKLFEDLQVFDMSSNELDKWIPEIWEPAHQLELATKDIKKDDTFKWFEEHIGIVKDTINVLNIGKGLEESLKALEDLGEKFFELKSLSLIQGLVLTWNLLWASLKRELRLQLWLCKKELKIMMRMLGRKQPGY